MSIVRASGAVIVASLLTGVSNALAEPPVPSTPRAGVTAAAPRGEFQALGNALPMAPENPYVPPACAGLFSDVACPGGFAVNWIERFYNDGITAGCNAAPLQYCPDATVTRAQMAVFVEKAVRGTLAWSPGDLGNSNTGLGREAMLVNGSGSWNTGVGNSALFNNSSGANNTGVGADALGTNTSASQNTAVGSSALISQSYDPGSPWASDNTAVGYNALTNNQPTSIIEGRENTAVGSQALQANTTGEGNTASGWLSLSSNTTGYNNVASGINAGQTNTTGSNNMFLGTFSDAQANNLTNATAIGYHAIVDASNHIRVGDTNVVQIGGQVAWSNLSDARAKNDIRDLDLGLDFVLALRPVSFTMKSGNARTDMGFVAQDVEALVGDEYNVLGIGGDAERTLSLRYTDLIAPLVKAVQEQQATIEAQRVVVGEQRAAMAALQERVQAQQATLQVVLARLAAVEDHPSGR